MRVISRRQFFLGVTGLVSIGFASHYWNYSRLEVAPPLANAINPSLIFFDVSSILTGLERPDPLLGRRIYHQVAISYPNHEVGYQQLIAHFRSNGIPANIPEEHVGLYRFLLSAWYLGVVDIANKAVCIAFEDSVSYQLVKPALLPPSYAPGAPGFWTRPPVIREG